MCMYASVDEERYMTLVRPWFLLKTDNMSDNNEFVDEEENEDDGTTG